jgi:hypothetical protein
MDGMRSWPLRFWPRFTAALAKREWVIYPIFRALTSRFPFAATTCLSLPVIHESDPTRLHRATMDDMIRTDFFQCDCCHVECRLDSESTESSTAQLVIRHCPDGKGIAVLGAVTRFQERRGGLWVDVQRWIDVA